MAGQIIGRVAVKVIPDTTDFRKDAKDKLDKIEKQLRKIKVRATFDETGLKSEVLKALRDLNNEIKNNDLYKVKFRATITEKGMDTEVRKAVRALNREAKGERVEIKLDAVAGLIDAELNKSSLQHVEKQLKDWRDDISPLNVEVAPTMLAGASSYVAGRLQWLTRPRTVEIIPKIDNTAMAGVATALAALSGARVLHDVFDGLWDRLKRLDKSVPIIGGVAEAVAGLGAWGLTAASNLFALSSSLAQIAGAGLALPGIFGGIAIGLGASFAALKDFGSVIPEVKQQLADLQDAMSQNFWNVAEQPIRHLIDSLLPQFSAGLKQTSTELGGFFGNLATSLEGVFNGALAGMFDDLSQSIQIFSGYTDNLASIIKTLGEVGAGYLPQLAGWFGGLLEKFDGFLTKAAEDGRLKGWIDQGIFQLQELGRALGNLGGIFHGLADIAEAAGGSTLTMFADTLQRIEDTVKGSTFTTVMTNALTAAHDAMSRISEIAGPAVEQFFIKLGETAARIFPLMGETVGTALEAVASALSQPGVADGLVKMFEGLQAGVAGIAPALAPVGQALGSLMELVGAMAAQMGPTLGAAFAVVAPAVQTVVAALIPLVNTLGPILRGAIEALAPVISHVAEVFAEIVTAAQPLVERIGELIQLVAPVLVPALKLLADIIGGAIIGVIEGAIAVFDGIKQAVQGFVDIFQGVVKIFSGDIQGGFAQVWEGIKGVFAGAFKAIFGAVKVWLNVTIIGFFRGGVLKLLSVWKGGWTSIKSAGQAVWNAIKSAITGFLNGVKSTWSAVWNGIKAVFTGVWNAIKSVALAVWNLLKGNLTGAMNAMRNVVSSVLNAIKGLWSAGWNLIKGVLKGTWNAMKEIVSAGVRGVMNFVKGIPGKVKAVFAGAGTWLLDAGRQIIEGLLGGISSMFDKVKGKLGELTNLLPDWKGPREKDKTLLYNAGQIIIQGLIKGLESQFGAVKSALGKLTDSIPDGVSKGLERVVTVTRSKLGKLLHEWERANGKLKEQADKLKALKEEAANYAASVFDSLRALGDVSKVGEGVVEAAREAARQAAEAAKAELEDATAEVGVATEVEIPMTFDHIKQGMKDAVSQTTEWAKALKQLSEMGLNKTNFDQLVQAGPEAGMEAAKLMIEAGKAGIEELNKIQKELDKQAKRAADIARKHMYENGINTAKGLLDGMKSMMPKIENEMRALARSLVQAIKSEFQIKSPSRVMRELGGYVGEGFALGIRDEVASVEAAMSALGDARPQASDFSRNIDNRISTEGPVVKQFIYQAAPGSSLGSEEDLFAAVGRSRMVDW